ncbi:zinc finger CCCH domain-containing protein 32-like [Phoenix dactylifera]|uniref:Zinc finger CCCH domain-containing protein 32-like n=1 Tax=Phoenix dactylifera TaxID=42345 RepID=A0A8B7D4Q6_PHODC|nr:zinc finger CCCH domain-containing protein 32-like [Phoenix dactylifera]
MKSGGGRVGIRPSTAEDEALKRNTDCVYFLASPLTCNKAHDTYGWESCRISERILERPPSGRRWRDANHNERDRSDLCRRPLKQRRLNGSISAVSPDGRGEPYQRDDCYIEERGHGHHSHRNQRQIPRSSISTRLQGRITLSGRSSPDIPNDLRSENDGNRGRPRGRLSPARPINYRGRHHERVRWRSNEEFPADARSTVVKLTRRDDTGSLDFAGPKSLAELKGPKVMENSQELSTKSTSAAAPLELNNMKSAKVAVLQDSKDSLSFEGPKPLSIILKRKRDAASASGASSGDEIDRRDGEEAAGGSVSAALSDVQSILPVEAKKDGNDNVSCLEEHEDRTAKEEEEEGSIYDGRSSAKEDTFEPKDHMVVDAMEDQELEYYDQRYGESDHEAVEGGDLKTEYDENVYAEDGDESDDEDDFAKKVAALLCCV